MRTFAAFHPLLEVGEVPSIPVHSRSDFLDGEGRVSLSIRAREESIAGTAEQLVDRGVRVLSEVATNYVR